VSDCLVNCEEGDRACEEQCAESNFRSEGSNELFPSTNNGTGATVGQNVLVVNATDCGIDNNTDGGVICVQQNDTAPCVGKPGSALLGTHPMSGLEIVTAIAEGNCNSSEARAYVPLNAITDWLCGNNGIYCPPAESTALSDAEKDALILQQGETIAQLNETNADLHSTLAELKETGSLTGDSVCSWASSWNNSQQKCELQCDADDTPPSSRRLLFGRLEFCRDKHCGLLPPPSDPPSDPPSPPPIMPPYIPPPSTQRSTPPLTPPYIPPSIPLVRTNEWYISDFDNGDAANKTSCANLCATHGLTCADPTTALTTSVVALLLGVTESSVISVSKRTAKARRPFVRYKVKNNKYWLYNLIEGRTHKCDLSQPSGNEKNGGNYYARLCACYGEPTSSLPPELDCVKICRDRSQRSLLRSLLFGSFPTLKKENKIGYGIIEDQEDRSASPCDC